MSDLIDKEAFWSRARAFPAEILSGNVVACPQLDMHFLAKMTEPGPLQPSLFRQRQIRKNTFRDDPPNRKP